MKETKLKSVTVRISQSFGHYSQSKAVVKENIDVNTSDRPCIYALVAGIDHYRGKSKRKIVKRSKTKPFVRLCTHNHLMPTRHSLDIPLGRTAVSRAL